MNRQFSIKVDADGVYEVNEQDHGMTFQFSNIIDALAYVRRQSAGEEVDVKCFDEQGRLTFTVGS